MYHQASSHHPGKLPNPTILAMLVALSGVACGNTASSGMGSALGGASTGDFATQPTTSASDMPASDAPSSGGSANLPGDMTSGGSSVGSSGGSGGAVNDDTQDPMANQQQAMGGTGGQQQPLPDPPEPLMPADGCTVYASPDGAGTECTAQVPCSLTGVRDKVRSLNNNMDADIAACLAGGTYFLEQPFMLDSSDSGSNGHEVLYRALSDDDAPVLSGGRVIEGFMLHDQDKNIYKAQAPGLESRQLFVDGQRATRARSNDDLGMKKTDTGFEASDNRMEAWQNKQRIEVKGNLDWRSYRCPVESVSGTQVTLQEPCWSLSQDVPSGWWNFKEVDWVENAYELLDEEGEFYLDVDAGELYYKPRQGEDMNAAEVIAPVLETLLHVQGTPENKASQLAFEGLTFAHGTWYEPNTSMGYTPHQSGHLHRVLEQYYDTTFRKVPSNLVLEAVDGVRFEGNTVKHLGLNGLDVFLGARNVSIEGNRFEDISGRTITLGHINAPKAEEPEVVKNITVRNNYLLRSGVEYEDCAIIFIAYTQDTLVEHNWLHHGPYTGISLGWGWAIYDQNETVAKNNVIRYNRIEAFMAKTFDGSGVYVLGPQPGSSVDHNYIVEGLPRGEGIFPDQGASYMDWTWNVIDNVGYEWIHDWSSRAHHNNISNNFTNQPNHQYVAGPGDTFENNQVIEGDNWPAEAREIIEKAGLQPAFQHLAE